MSCKTKIPFQLSQTDSGDGLPGAGEVVTLFNSVTAFGAKTMHLMGDIYWFSYTITPDTNATGNSVTAQYSEDGGTTWIEFYASASNEPVGDSSAFSDEIPIGNYQDVRVLFNNGAAAQTSFTVSMVLDSNNRAVSQ